MWMQEHAAANIAKAREGGSSNNSRSTKKLRGQKEKQDLSPRTSKRRLNRIPSIGNAGVEKPRRVSRMASQESIDEEKGETANLTFEGYVPKGDTEKYVLDKPEKAHPERLSGISRKLSQESVAEEEEYEEAATVNISCLDRDDQGADVAERGFQRSFSPKREESIVLEDLYDESDAAKVVRPCENNDNKIALSDTTNQVMNDNEQIEFMNSRGELESYEYEKQENGGTDAARCSTINESDQDGENSDNEIALSGSANQGANDNEQIEFMNSRGELESYEYVQEENGRTDAARCSTISESNQDGGNAEDETETIDIWGALEPFGGSNNRDQELNRSSQDERYYSLTALESQSVGEEKEEEGAPSPFEERQSAPGAFYATIRAGGERPAWVQQQQQMLQASIPTSRRTMFNLQQTEVPPEMRSVPLAESDRFSRRLSGQFLSRRLSSFFNRHNVITAEVEVHDPKKTSKKKWFVITLLILIVAAIAVGLGVGLSGNNSDDDKQIQEPSVTEEICAYNDAQQISIAWKRCLCQENATDIPGVYKSQYDLIKTTLLDGLGLDLYYIDPCEPTNIAMLWLAEDAVANNMVYDEYRVVSRFALAVCFLSWYDYEKPWQNKDGWMTSDNECKWFGVMCNEENEVISISLRNNQLSGSIPEQFALLSQLSRFDLDANAITDIIPTELGRLRNLVRLDLQNNKIGGRVPTEIGQLTVLKDIDLSSNFISGTLPTSIASCLALQELRLTNNMLITTIPTELGNLGNLEILDLSYQEELNGVIPTTIGSCASLKEIRLDNGRKMTGIIPAEIGQLFDLQVFSAGYNEISGSIPSTFANLSQLAMLNLMANRLTGMISPRIGLNNTLLEQIRLTANLILGDIPTEIGLLSNLIALEIAETKIEGYIPTELGLCTSLQLIDVSNNLKLSGEVPSELGSLSGLEKFNLAKTAMVGNMPLEICELPKLESLVADCHTKITNCDCCTQCLG